MAGNFSAYFANFAKSGARNDPNAVGVSHLWQPFDSSFQLMHFKGAALTSNPDAKFENEPRGGALGGVALVEEVTGSQPQRCGQP
jgi:hypothetical protein